VLQIYSDLTLESTKFNDNIVFFKLLTILSTQLFDDLTVKRLKKIELRN